MVMDGTRTVTHTPGPWAWRQMSHGDVQLITVADNTGRTSNDRVIFTLREDWRTFGERHGVADARLITAAPDLLKAAQDVLEDAVSDMPATVRITKGSLDALRAAIAKATGGE